MGPITGPLVADLQVKRSVSQTWISTCHFEQQQAFALGVDDKNLATKLLDPKVSIDLRLMSSPSHYRRLTGTTKKAIKTTNLSYRKWKNAVTANQDYTITRTLWQKKTGESQGNY